MTRRPEIDLSDHVRFDLALPEDVERLAETFGLSAQAGGRPNLVYVHRRAGRMAGGLTLHGQGNRLLFGPACAFRGEIVAVGSNARAAIHGGQHALTLQLTLYDGARFDLGTGTNAYGLRAWVGGGTDLTIGEGCLFSEGIAVRTTDHHTLFDLDTFETLNGPRSVRIGALVWFGQNVTVLKGASIGHGSVLGAHSLVTGTVPPCELWAGSPARRVRRAVSWTDEHPASGDDMRRRQSMLQKLGCDIR